MADETTESTVRLSSKGQIVIPSKIRERLGLQDGDKLVVKETNGTIQIESLEKTLQRRRAGFMDELDKLSKEIGKDWPDGVDSVQIIREQRR